MEELKACRTYCPCDECPYGIEMREGSGDDSECKICEFAKLLNRRAEPENKALTLEQLRQMCKPILTQLQQTEPYSPVWILHWATKKYPAELHGGLSR